jgi:hypothetical protein
MPKNMSLSIAFEFLLKENDPILAHAITMKAIQCSTQVGAVIWQSPEMSNLV